MAEFKHDMAEVSRIQKNFEERFVDAEWMVGVGVGLNQAEDDLALSVFVKTEDDLSKLPTEFEGVEVVSRVVERFERY